MTVTLAQLDQSFYQQFISTIIGMAVQIPATYNFFVAPLSLANFASATYRHTFRDEIADAVPVAELDDVPDGDITDNASDVTVQTIGRSALVSWETSMGGTIAPNELARATMKVVRAVRRKIDDLLWTDTAPGLTNEFGSDVTPMTYAQHVAFALELASQVEEEAPPGSVMRAALAKGVWRALVQDMITTEASIFAATFGSMDAAMAVGALGQVQKSVAGVGIFVTDRIAASGAGKANPYVYVGPEDGSAFGLAVKWPIGAEVRTTEQKLADRVVGWARIGPGILRQDYGIEGITAAA